MACKGKKSSNKKKKVTNSVRSSGLKTTTTHKNIKIIGFRRKNG